MGGASASAGPATWPRPSRPRRRRGDRAAGAARRPVYLLLVEDDARIARVVERALVEAGHRIDVVHDGTEGLVRAEGGAYDLLLLDVMLPGMDGVDVARQLRRQKVRTPIL